MKRSLLSVLVLLFCFTGLLGQPAERGEYPRSWGRALFAPGASFYEGDSQSFFTTGAAWEGLLAGNLGMGLEVAYLAPFSGAGNGFGTFSPGVLYQFGSSKTRPFVTGGYTLFFRTFAESGAFVGAGVNHWVSDRWGLGFEGRDQIGVADNIHFVQFRVNFLFR